MCKAWQLIFSCFSLCALVKRCLVTFFLQKKKVTRAGARNSPSRARHFLIRCRFPDCACTAFRCRCPLLRQKLFVLPCRRLRNNYILCPTGTPTFAAARRQRRDLIIAKNDQRTNPYPRTASAAAAQAVQAVPRTDNNVTHRTNSARSAPPILHNP